MDLEPRKIPMLSAKEWGDTVKVSVHVTTKKESGTVVPTESQPKAADTNGNSSELPSGTTIQAPAEFQQQEPMVTARENPLVSAIRSIRRRLGR